MSDLHESASSAIKITDRRRFTAKGEVRSGVELDREIPRPSPQPAPRAEAKAAPKEAPRAEAHESSAPSDEPPLRIELLPFVASLASNALTALGAVPEGQQSGMPPNPTVAREYIDIIVMLERKTRGNVTPDEAKTLKQIIADLRLHFVETTRSVQPVR